MTDLEEIKKELSTALPGTQILIKGYRNSSGEVSNLDVTLLSGKDYPRMQEEDLKILESYEDDGSDPDVLTALQNLIESKRKAIQRRQSGEETHRGPSYMSLGGSLGAQSGSDAVYILRVKHNGKVPEPKPAKGAIPRAKQRLIRDMDLPTRRYVHALKLEPGKFEDVQVFVRCKERGS